MKSKFVRLRACYFKDDATYHLNVNITKRIAHKPDALDKIKADICRRERINPKNVEFKIIRV